MSTLDLPEITLVTVVNAGLEVVQLMWRSYCHHNPFAKFWCYDNNSKGAVSNYMRCKADKVFHCYRNAGHGAGLDTMCKLVYTPYTLVVDMDIEFKQPAVERMKLELQKNPRALCTAYPSYSEECVIVSTQGINNLVGQKRINPCCALFNTDKLQHLLKFCSFGTFIGEYGFYDAGSMLYHIAYASSMTVVEPVWLREEAVKHYGNLGSYLLGHFATDKNTTARLSQVHQQVKDQVALYKEVEDRKCEIIQIPNEKELLRLRGVNQVV